MNALSPPQRKNSSDRNPKLRLPLFACSVQAGFPSPADDYIETLLDLNEHMVSRPSSTFYVRVTGDSMIGAGILSGDILVVDRSLNPKDGSIVIAVVNDELTVKRLWKKNEVCELHSENPNFPPIKFFMTVRQTNKPWTNKP